MPAGVTVARTHSCLAEAARLTKEPLRRSTKRGLETCRALYLGDVFSLEALGALADLELDKLAFVQRLISVHLNRGKVNEDILSRLTLNEPISL